MNGEMIVSIVLTIVSMVNGWGWVTNRRKYKVEVQKLEAEVKQMEAEQKQKYMDLAKEYVEEFLLVLTAVGGAYKREDGVFVAPINLFRP